MGERENRDGGEIEQSAMEMVGGARIGEVT